VNFLRTVIIIFHTILALGVIVTILLQSGKSAGLSGAIAGGAETFFGKKKGLDELLGKLAAVFAIGFLLTSLLLSTSIAK
jgi:preprotein translocase subunit SecG